MFDPKGRKKWEAWTAKKGMGKEEAMRAYIE
jgi:acyl-CoA-binding protein